MKNQKYYLHHLGKQIGSIETSEEAPVEKFTLIEIEKKIYINSGITGNTINVADVNAALENMIDYRREGVEGPRTIDQTIYEVKKIKALLKDQIDWQIENNYSIDVSLDLFNKINEFLNIK